MKLNLTHTNPSTINPVADFKPDGNLGVFPFQSYGPVAVDDYLRTCLTDLLCASIFLGQSGDGFDIIGGANANDMFDNLSGKFGVVGFKKDDMYIFNIVYLDDRIELDGTICPIGASGFSCDMTTARLACLSWLTDRSVQHSPSWEKTWGELERSLDRNSTEEDDRAA